MPTPFDLRDRESTVNCNVGCRGKPAVTKTAMKPGFTKLEERLREFIRGGSPHEFQSLALELFSLQFAHNPTYRRFCEAEDRAPERVGAWSDIPAVPTTAFKEFELTSIPAGQ